APRALQRGCCHRGAARPERGERPSMAPKKKPAKEGEEDPFDIFLKKYTKTQKEYDVPKIAKVQEIISRTEEEGPVKQWNFDAEFDTMSFRILWQTLRQTGFTEIDAIRLWKCNGGDESVRSVCYYLDGPQEPTVKEWVKDVAFTDNGVTALGCEFLGRTLGPNGNKFITKLVLDYNKFGAAGVEKLSLGLSQNSTLKHLSLNHCGIGPDGGEFIGHILIFCKSALEILELKGNDLENQGVIDVFRGARRAKALRHLDVFDNKFSLNNSEAPEVLRALRDLFTANTNLVSYDLGANRISDEGAQDLVKDMRDKGHTHLQSVMVTERCMTGTFAELELQLSKGKGKKKGKKKK
ncbi:unnamed protein product, partial [Prorocentrum cordatum]